MHLLSPQRQAEMLVLSRNKSLIQKPHRGAIQQMFKDDNLWLVAGMFAAKRYSTNGGKGKLVVDLRCLADRSYKTRA